MLEIDYSGMSDFFDTKNKRSLSIEEAVVEGYFKTLKEAEEYKELFEREDFDTDSYYCKNNIE